MKVVILKPVIVKVYIFVRIRFKKRNNKNYVCRSSRGFSIFKCSVESDGLLLCLEILQGEI